MPTSSSSASGISLCACTALIFGNGLVSLTMQPPSIASANAPPSPAISFALIAPSFACVLLIFDVFLPELFLELRIRLLLGGFAQAARHDVIVAAVRNIGAARA